jgi:hypothetical protein
MRYAYLTSVLLALCSLAGCQGITGGADPVYKRANAARYTAVKPWLDDYATLRPDRAQRVADVTNSWGKEVEAQARSTAAATQPAK